MIKSVVKKIKAKKASLKVLANSLEVLVDIGKSIALIYLFSFMCFWWISIFASNLYFLMPDVQIYILTQYIPLIIISSICLIHIVGFAILLPRFLSKKE